MSTRSGSTTARLLGSKHSTLRPPTRGLPHWEQLERVVPVLDEFWRE